MASNYTVIINGVDITSMIEVDSYATDLIPVYGGSVTTMDGVEHVSVLRHKGKLSFSVNTLTDTQTAKLNDVLQPTVVEVQYHCLQRNTIIIATMKTDGSTARHLGRVRFGGCRWNELSGISLTEL